MLKMKMVIHVILACICMYASHADRTYEQQTFPSTTIDPETTASVNDCPVIIITPSFQYADYGKEVRFSGVIEAKLEFPTEARWQKVKNGNVLHNLDLNDEKYSGSDGLSPPLLLINEADFDDVGDYRLQVKISTGWCSNNTVQIQHVYGILQYNASCTLSRECDERKELRCSSTNTCLCHSSYYPYNQTCYPKYNYAVSISTSSINTSMIQFQWSHPSHSDLINDYTVNIRQDNGTNITGTTVGKQTSYSYNYHFVPGYRYYFKITSNVKIPNPSEQFNEYKEWSIVVAPLPPGLIDRYNSIFHPEKLHLKWAIPPNNTRVEYYSIAISNPSSSYRYGAYSNELVTNRRFQPGMNYTVTIKSRSYSTYSQPHTEEFQTLRTPLLTITPSGWPNVPYLSDLVIQCTVVNNTDFPPTLETKWRRNQIDVNISDSKYSGSSLDVYKPKLVINRIDFVQDDDDVYQCAARNSEGWGTSERTLKVDVKGSIKFQQQCNQSRECLYGANLVCSSQQCLCHPSYYHKDQICHHLNNLRARFITVSSSTCGISIRWDPPYRDADLITGYEVFLQEYTNVWRSFDKVSVGNTTHYSTPCNLESGRLHQFFIRSKINLHNPVKQMFVDSLSLQHIVEPRKPGSILSSLSNFSADGLRLVWEESDAFVNRYRVEIDGHWQETLDSKPEIDWNRLLLPVTQYNVTITAISYGYVTNYPSYGRKKSQPAANWIMTTESQYSGKAYMSYGDEDFIMAGDRVTSGMLRSPTTVYVGDGSSGGFNYVVVGSNGIIGLGENFNGESIHGMDSKFVKERQILCPFWADLASSDDVGKVYYNTYRRGKEGENVDGMFMEKADSIVKKHFKDFGDFQATWLVKVTWENMTLYGHKDKKVTFQCFLITDGDNTFAVINYMDINMAPIENFNISIGYRYKKDLFVKNSFTKQKGAFIMSYIPGNRGERGFWIYKMSEGVQSRRDEKLCFFWYSFNIEKQIHHGLANVLDAIECPCDHRLLRFDPRYAINRFDKINRILCYASMTLGTNVECCYDMYANVDQLGPLRRSVPFAGTVLQYNPFFQRYQYTNYDSNPRKLCCSSGHCNWYYEVRPIPRCYRRSPFQPGINFGDPHITTLDGMDYTFNGFGEYTMLSINTSTASFILQARTELASSANGTAINATVFTAFVAEDHTGSKVQIEMARNKEELVIKGNGLDLTNRFKNESYIFMKQNLTISWQNQSIVATFLKTLNTIKISLGKRFLICETLINEKYKGQTIGLMGNFDGNKTNDFILPNGTSLPENATNSERKIYNHFGQLWSVNDASLFQYDDELTFKNFTHPEFVPMFTDEVDTGKLNEAKQKCGSNSSKACIADYLATGDIALAEISGKKEQVSKSDIKIIENEIPSITGNTTLFVEVDKEVEMKFNVSDDGKEKPKLKLLKYPNNFTLDDETSSARWLPQKNSIPEISIVAIDSHGAQSSSLEYQIIQCDGCGEHGDCDFENLLSTENDQFHKALCVCHVGYSGDQCSQDTNACSQSPCPLGRNCTDLTPEEEERLGRGYNCSSCPSGYTEVDNKCQDINECTSNNTNSCDKSKETCENTDGGYICNCLEGYRKLKDQCNDINECLEKSSGCEQGCQNTPGSFNCSCVPGYTLNADKRTCRKTDHDLCKNFNKQCEYACSIIDRITQCICPSGYELTDDGITCTDTDECNLETNPCDQDCINRNGSFQCTCRPGFALSADRTTCSRCELPNYGVNCSQECKCGPGVDRCDPVSGCVCQSGWTGNNCDTDIDECQENPTICGNAMICNNTEGSYRCNCQKGFQLLDGNCQDIDECADDLLNDCPVETTRCVNTYGNYNCECQQGYQNNGSSCEDVDECKMSTHECSQVCENTPGGYNCLCFFGFALKEDRVSCEEVKDSCSLYPDLNCTYGCKKINEHKGVCFCESGYELQDNGTCIDINECRTSSTCAHNCTNKIGSFECSCAIGYRLGNDGSSCTACNQDFYGENCQAPCRCGRGSKECNHITGCICNEGWNGDACEEDINECHLNNTCSGVHEVCVNTPGSYRCDCDKGYQNISGICQDINECEDLQPCHHLCFNTNGSYTCGCKSGYELTNSKDCVDIDECQKARCSRCSNWPGSFKCSCDDGYRLNLTTLNVCDNINECEEETHNCSTNATCTDTEGGFNCSCHVGLEGNGYNCTVCTGFHYGEQCSEECICNRINSEVCDAVTGKCHCKAGWTGSDCTQDVNECETSDRTCNKSSYQTCFNTVGSFYCECLYGGVNITNCTRPLPPIPINDTSAKVKAEVRFDLNITQNTFLKESENLRFEFETQLQMFHEKEISGFSALVVLSIRFGSVYVEYEIVGAIIDARFEKDVATVISKMFKGDIKLTISNYGPINVLRVSLKTDNGTEKASFTSSDDVTPCSFLKHIGDCAPGYYCEDSSSRAECIKMKSDFSVIAIITISAGVGVPLLITIIVTVIVWKRVTKRTLKEKHKRLSGDMTEYMGKIPRPSQCNEYDYIPSDAMPRYVYTKDIGCIERESNWDSLSEKLGQHQEFRIQRPNVHGTKSDNYMY